MAVVLVVRLDSAGDVLLAGPAVRAVAAGARRVVLLAGPRGRAAADLLPGVDEVLTWECPWVDLEPGPTRRDDVLAMADTIRSADASQAVILTSYHQSPLPTALLLRLAGVPHVTAASEDYPGSLLDVRHRLPETGLHEVERMLSVAEAAGFAPPADQRLRLRAPLPDVSGLLNDSGLLSDSGLRDGRGLAGRGLAGGDGPAAGARPYVVVHPGAAVPARAPLAEHCAGYVTALAADGWPVIVTGAPAERALTRQVAAGCAVDLGGRTGLAELAAVLAGAAAVVTGNTGPAHVAAAVGTPVVSLFAPTVPLERWRPWRVPHVVLGDQGAPCAGSRARSCPVAGHPCLASVTPERVSAAVRQLTGTRTLEVA
ncbi:MAG: glycosyltransferase family 9 protein [Streptosporangiaceae bacterium]|nr:glycosyltransferase family 9 protein [Streptosporangiaceae bacterium]